MRNLLITTGHNSSAILVEDNEVVWGFETERLTGVKSDSSFPATVLAHHAASSLADMVYVSHWDPHGLLRNVKHKHFMPEYVDGKPIRTYDPDFTHHDGHAYAAINFADPDPFSDWHVLVVDGFGNYGEHLSYYEVKFVDPISPTHAMGGSVGIPKLLQRFRGYNTSLGLMYQYATAFVGMRMNEDEYKFLGYGSRIDAWMSRSEREVLDSMVEVAVGVWANEVSKPAIYAADDPVFNLNALEEVKATRFRELGKVLEAFGVTDPTTTPARAIVGYYVQGVLEGCVLSFLAGQGTPRNLIVTGGCFMNVKLSQRLLDRDDVDRLCVHPLCGDQGNALGMYARDNPLFRFPDDLFWGRRNLFPVDGVVEELYQTNRPDVFWDHVGYELNHRGVVNVVRGAMEFGPRALCNTSTLAKPTLKNVEFINDINERDTVMPMAPVVTEDFYRAHFKNVHKLHRSERFMVCALQYVDMRHEWVGAANRYVDLDGNVSWTGRPQVLYRDMDDANLYELVDSMGGILINTSLNYHGKPICYDVMDVVQTHRLNRARGSDLKTYVLEN